MRFTVFVINKIQSAFSPFYPWLAFYTFQLISSGQSSEFMVSEQAAHMAAAFIAADALSTMPRPLTPAQIIAAVAASPQPVQFTISVVSQGKLYYLAALRRDDAVAAEETKTFFTPSRSRASAANSEVVSFVMLFCLELVGLAGGELTAEPV